MPNWFFSHPVWQLSKFGESLGQQNNCWQGYYVEAHWVGHAPGACGVGKVGKVNGQLPRKKRKPYTSEREAANL